MISQIRSTTVIHDTSSYAAIDLGNMYQPNQAGCVTRFPIYFTPVLLPEAFQPAPMPKSRRVVTSAFVSGVAPLRDRIRPMTLGQHGFLHTINGPRSPIGSRKLSEIQLVDAGVLKLPKPVVVPADTKDHGPEAEKSYVDRGGCETSRESERSMRQGRRHAISLPRNIPQPAVSSSVVASVASCCSTAVGPKKSTQPSPSLSYAHRPYSTSSVVNPNSSLLSPPSSPEMTHRKLVFPALEATKPFELPQTRPCSEPAAKSSVPIPEPRILPPKLADTPTNRPRLPITAPNRVTKLSRNKPAPLTRNADPESRICYSCGAKESPCWRPSWSAQCGQLCNSCGLRYRKTRIYCPSEECRYVPSKIELAELRANPSMGMRCPHCTTKLHLK